MSNTVAAAIIAGGRGSRLGGTAKGLLVVHGQRIIDRQLALLRGVFSRVVIIANEPGPYADLNLPVLPDRRGGGLGPIAGIETALATLLPHERGIVCVAADMPFISADVLRALRDHAPAAAALAPQISGFFEPLCARYSRACHEVVRSRIEAGHYKLMELLAALPATRLPLESLCPQDTDGRFATNINTREDLERALCPLLKA